MTKERKIIVKRVREEGQKAAKEGKHKQTNPYPTYSMDHYQWYQGYSMEEEERCEEEERGVPRKGCQGL